MIKMFKSIIKFTTSSKKRRIMSISVLVNIGLIAGAICTIIRNREATHMFDLVTKEYCDRAIKIDKYFLYDLPKESEEMRKRIEKEVKKKYKEKYKKLKKTGVD